MNRSKPTHGETAVGSRAKRGPTFTTNGTTQPGIAPLTIPTQTQETTWAPAMTSQGLVTLNSHNCAGPQKQGKSHTNGTGVHSQFNFELVKHAHKHAQLLQPTATRGHTPNAGNTVRGQAYERLRPPRRPSWTCACGSCASTSASSRCAWPTAWRTSSCRPSWRTPSCARHVSSAPWL